MKMTQLSVSSAILAAVLSGCSQQQVIGGSQVVGGSQQMAGSSQISGASQQQVETAVPVIAPAVVQPRRAAPAPRIRHVVKPKQRTYKRIAKPRPRHSVSRNGLPAAKPGQCFAKVKVPAKYITKSRRILIQKASAKRVLVRAPQYRWTNKKVLVRKAQYRTRVQPAQYRNSTKRVMVKPAYNTWRPGHGAITRIDNMTGQIMCRVKVPAVYKNVSRKVLLRPAKTIRTLIPAVYKTVKQKARVSQALYKTVRRPARYKTQNYRVKVGGARYVWRAILCQTNAPKHYRAKQQRKAAAPARKYRQAPKQYKRAIVKRKPVVRTQNKKQYQRSGISYQDYLRVMNAGSGKSSIKRVKKKTTKSAVTKKRVAPKAASKTEKQSKSATKKGIVYGIQQALKAKGFDPGTLDGKMGAGTAAALKAFQSSRGLPVGQLTKDTFKALGLIK